MNEPSNFNTNEDRTSNGLLALKCPLSGKDGKYDNPPYKTFTAYSRVIFFIICKHFLDKIRIYK